MCALLSTIDRLLTVVHTVAVAVVVIGTLASAFPEVSMPLVVVVVDCLSHANRGNRSKQ